MYVWTYDLCNKKIELEDSKMAELKDSGNRTEFETGAVRDIQEGKGRCDLLPLDTISYGFLHLMGTSDFCDYIIGAYIGNHMSDGKNYAVNVCARDMNFILSRINSFQNTQSVGALTEIIAYFILMDYGDYSEEKEDLTDTNRYIRYISTAILDLAVHFEDGAKKYGDNNWRNGIPLDRYIDSATRHFLKYMRGDHDEPHDRAFLWNLFCCLWTLEHVPSESSAKLASKIAEKFQ